MYRELGSRSEFLKTPIRELQELRISIIAEVNIQVEQQQEAKLQQEEREAEMERLKRQQGRSR